MVKKPKINIIAAICMVLICAMFAGCVAAEPGVEENPSTPTVAGSSVEEVPEVKQTVYLPATYKLVGEWETNNGETVQRTIEKQFTYDDAGRCVQCVVTEESEEVGHWVQTITFAYDERGNLISERNQSKSERNGRVFESDTLYTIRYTYDQKGRAERCEIEKVFSNSNGTNQTSVETYALAYDEQGNLVTLTVGTEGACWYYYSYDEQGRMIAETSCVLLQEGAPNADKYKYRYTQRVYSRNEQGKVTSDYYQRAYSVENVGAAGLDQLEFQFDGNGYYTFHYDANGNLSGVNEPDQYKYDENGQWIPEEKHETIKYRGEEIDRLLAKYTQDEQGNIIRFENYQYTEELTYTALELTETQMVRTERFFNHRSYLGDVCMVPNYVFQNFYPDWLPGVTYYNYFMNIFKNLPW